MAPLTSARSIASQVAAAVFLAACQRDVARVSKDVTARECPVGQRAQGPVCVVDAQAPRPIAPRSLGDVTQRRPTLRWSLPAGYDGAVVELCRDRRCASVIETINAQGDHARPASDLPARSVVFWRLRGRRGLATGPSFGPTWLFHVPAVSASTGRDASASARLDVNGDGYDDVAVSASNPDPDDRSLMGRVRTYLGSASGPTTTPSREFAGELATDLYGASIASAGDVDGDGFGDLVVGAPYATLSGHVRVGTVSVYLGSASGLIASPSNIITVNGDTIEAFGASVAGAGDVNGDGYDDIIVGAPLAIREGRVNTGVVRVYLGSASGISSAPSSTYEGTSPDDRFGASVAGAGDVNGDGYDDVIVGAWFASRGARSVAGEVRLFFGGALGLSRDASHVFEGATSDVGLGIAVAGAGDVNCDGFSDVVVGASRSSPGGRERAGEARIYHGSVAGLAAEASRVLEGRDAMGSFGFAVAGAGDVNGDGFDDVIVGAYGASPSGRELAGSASVFHGGASGVEVSASATLMGEGARPRFGYAVAGAGDVDGDGYDDVIVGAYSASPGGRAGAGTASVFRGGALGVSPVAAQVFEGASSGECMGYSIARVDALFEAPMFACVSASRRSAPST